MQPSMLGTRPPRNSFRGFLDDHEANTMTEPLMNITTQAIPKVRASSAGPTTLPQRAATECPRQFPERNAWWFSLLSVQVFHGAIPAATADLKFEEPRCLIRPSVTIEPGLEPHPYRRWIIYHSRRLIARD